MRAPEQMQHLIFNLADGDGERANSFLQRRGGCSAAKRRALDERRAVSVAVQRIDPNGSNPFVQANATGFRAGVVQMIVVRFATGRGTSLSN
jgi:hypothetical protein